MAASLKFTFSYKGKEYLFVEETKKNLETLQCPVCFEIVLESVQTSVATCFVRNALKVLPHAQSVVSDSPACRITSTTVESGL